MATGTRRSGTGPKGRGPQATFSNGTCPSCGTGMRERAATLRLPVNGNDIAVPNASHFRCPKCHEIVLRMDQARVLQ